jgi:hypothetical protein
MTLYIHSQKNYEAVDASKQQTLVMPYSPAQIDESG